MSHELMLTCGLDKVELLGMASGDRSERLARRQSPFDHDTDSGDSTPS